MSTLSPGALYDGLRSPPAHPAKRPARLAPASATSNRSRGTPGNNPAARASRHASVTLKQQHRDELDRILASTTEIGQLLSELGPDDVDQAMAVIFAARSQLDQTERQLVRLALQTGQSWARIGAALGIRNGRATHEHFGNTR